MPTTSTDSQGQMQIQHPETGLNVKAVALLQLLGGLDVRLVDNVPTLLQTLLTSVGGVEADLATLLGLPESLDTLEALIGVNASTAPANDTATANLNGRLIRVAQRLSTIHTSVSPINDKLDDILTALQGGNVAPGTPILVNVTVPHRGTTPPGDQVAFIFPAGTRQLSVRCREGAAEALDTLYYSWLPDKTGPQTGDQAGGFGTIRPGQVLVESEFALTASKTLYLSADTTNVVASIAYWRTE